MKIGMFFLVLLLVCWGNFLKHVKADFPAGMVLIPSGSFTLGASSEDGIEGIDVGVDQIPRHRISLKSFYIDQNEVTVGEYRQFVQQTRHQEPCIWTDPGFSKPPDQETLSDVSYFDAEAYCEWKGKRLPTEEEWEKAARGTDGRRWPWGNDFYKERTNTLESGLKKVVPPETFQGDVSPYGVHDMAGNVMEWTSSWYEPYPGNTLKRTAFGKKFKILRGGTWSESATPFARTTHRFPVLPSIAQPDFGIRCAKDVFP